MHSSRRGDGRRIRLALFSPDPDLLSVHFVGRSVEDTPGNRRTLAQRIERYNLMAEDDSSIDWCLGVFVAPPKLSARVRRRKPNVVS